MDLLSLIPKDKSDIETAKRLHYYSYEELKPIIPDLLEWIQDLNWPVAQVIAPFLVSITNEITNDIINILRGNDDVWKYWCITVFAFEENKIDDRLITEIERIAKYPSGGEIKEEVQQIALEALQRLK